MVNERRRNRSEVPNVAASLFLESMASRNNLRAVVLAGGDGLLMAGAGGAGGAGGEQAGVDCDGLAALGVARQNRVSVEPELVESIVGRGRVRAVHTSRFDIGGEMFYLTSVGARRPPAAHVKAALRRILGPSLSPSASA